MYSGYFQIMTWNDALSEIPFKQMKVITIRQHGKNAKAGKTERDLTGIDINQVLQVYMHKIYSGL